MTPERSVSLNIWLLTTLPVYADAHRRHRTNPIKISTTASSTLQCLLQHSRVSARTKQPPCWCRTARNPPAWSSMLASSKSLGKKMLLAGIIREDVVVQPLQVVSDLFHWGSIECDCRWSGRDYFSKVVLGIRWSSFISRSINCKYSALFKRVLNYCLCLTIFLAPSLSAPCVPHFHLR